MKTLISRLVIVATMLGAGTAAAQPAGSYMANFKFGPALNINDAVGQLHLGFDFGAAMSSASRSRVYFILPLEFGVGGGLTRIQIEPGVQVDVHLPVGAPLYITPHAGAGIGILSYSGYCPRCTADFAFAFNLGAGIKYVLDHTINFSFEPIRLDFFPVGSNQAGAPVWYSLLFGAGVNF
jgi:hypothetical protein